MKALVCEQYGSIKDLKYSDTSIPKIAPDEVLVEVDYCGVNFPDTLIVEGKYQFKPELPFIPGGEVSGVIKEIGSAVKNLQVGDTVISAMGWGGFAEFAVAKANNTFKVGANELKAGAALLETFGTVIHALKDRGNMQRGEVIAVLGASGGTGNAAIQIGKVMGAKVIAIAGSAEKLDFAAKAGADHQIDYQKEDLKSALKALGGVDLVFDPVGGPASEDAFRALKPFGRHLVVGFASGAIPQLPWNLPLLKSASIVGVFWGHFWRNYTEKNRENIHELIEWMKKGLIKPTITKSYPLKGGVKALMDIRNREAIGKIVLRVKG